MSQQKFINRKEELAFLNKKYKSDKAEFIVIYGRRRIGKSELINKFLNNKGIYYLCSTEGDTPNITRFMKYCKEFFKDDLFEQIQPNDWRGVFKLIKQITEKQQHKIAIALDEFPFLIQANNSIPSIFQQIWEEIKNSNIMLIISGSYISVMEQQVLGFKSPLYGRNTGIWQVQPMKIEHIKEFHTTSFQETIETACIVGGIPAYLKQFESDNTTEENIKEQLLTKGSPLYVDAEIILEEEFREPRNYKLILEAIARGKTKLNEIVQETGMDKSQASKYISVLKKTGIICDEKPVLAKHNFRGRQYFISDPYFTFWFRFVYPNKTDVESHRTKAIYTNIKHEIQQFIGRQFETIVKDIIKRKIAPATARVGRQWGKYVEERKTKTYEIDCMAFDKATKTAIVTECKWQEQVDGAKVLAELQDKTRHAPMPQDTTITYYIVAKSFKNITPDGECVDMKRLEQITT